MLMNKFSPRFRKEVYGSPNNFNYKKCGNRPDNGTDDQCVGCLCSSGSSCTLSLNSPQALSIENRRIYNTFRIRSSEFTMNKAAFNVFAGRSPTFNLSWNQSSDRSVAGISRAIVPSRGSSVRGTRTGTRPGSQGPGGIGVDIKHNSYDRYLLRKKGKAMNSGPYVGDEVDPNAVVNNKVQAQNSLGANCCPEQDINAVIVGTSGDQPVIWRSPPVTLDIGSYSEGFANSVNASDVIVGFVSNDTHVKPAYWANSTASVTVLSLHDGTTPYNDGLAYSVNSDGVSVGYVQGDGVEYTYTKPAYWENRTASVTVLNLSDGNNITYNGGVANSVNSDGVSVGYVYVQDDVSDLKPAYWASNADSVTVLNLTDKNNITYKQGVVVSVNSDGVSVGYVGYYDGTSAISKAAYWASPTAKLTVLEDLYGEQNSLASSIQ